MGQGEKATGFLKLHLGPQKFVLPNVWDVVSDRTDSAISVGELC